MNELLKCIEDLTGSDIASFTITYVKYFDGYSFKFEKCDKKTGKMYHAVQNIPKVGIMNDLDESKIMLILNKLYEDIKKKEVEDERLD